MVRSVVPGTLLFSGLWPQQPLIPVWALVAGQVLAGRRGAVMPLHPILP
jgi:hypothetical protein